jgi:hypothetical protein
VIVAPATVVTITRPPVTVVDSRSGNSTSSLALSKTKTSSAAAAQAVITVSGIRNRLPPTRRSNRPATSRNLAPRPPMSPSGAWTLGPLEVRANGARGSQRDESHTDQRVQNLEEDPEQEADPESDRQRPGPVMAGPDLHETQVPASPQHPDRGCQAPDSESEGKDQSGEHPARCQWNAIQPVWWDELVALGELQHLDAATKGGDTKKDQYRHRGPYGSGPSRSFGHHRHSTLPRGALSRHGAVRCLPMAHTLLLSLPR